MKYALIVLVAVVLFYGYKRSQDRAAVVKKMEYKQALARGDDPCSKKKSCLIVYVAPWCPYCQQQEENLRQFARKHSDNREIGIKVFVGQGQQLDDNRRLAATFGKSGVADDSGEHLRQWNVRSFPTFYVVASDGSVLLDKGEAFAWFQQNM